MTMYVERASIAAKLSINMPIMRRPKKAEKIVRALLGPSTNMMNVKRKRSKRNRKLDYEESRPAD